jgi:predicted NAD/FAD-binding protein
MPGRRSAWASWNVQTGGDDSESRVTYWMNRLQSLDAPKDFFVTLNPNQPIEQVWAERDYSHPLFDVAARAAQQRKAEVNGVDRIWFCGAYWGWGFHEDGFASAVGSVRSYFAAQQELKNVA